MNLAGLTVNKPYCTGLTIIIFGICLYQKDVLKCYDRRFRTETERVFNETKDSEHDCDRVVKLAAYDQLPVVYLNSFPGSGNT